MHPAIGRKVSPLGLSGMTDAFPIASSKDFVLMSLVTQPMGSVSPFSQHRLEALCWE
jgi:hypothetical protein